MGNAKLERPAKKEYTKVKGVDRARYIAFHDDLVQASDEEDVKFSYVKFFHLPHDTSKRRDLYTAEVLYEFKYDKNMKRIGDLAEILAQILYYVRRLKYEPDDQAIPPYLCLADVNEAVVTETAKWMPFVDDNKYDWTLAPSSPDTLLIADLKKSSIEEEHVFDLFDLHELQTLDKLMGDIYTHHLFGAPLVKKDINERNFENVFTRWDAKFGEAVKNGIKPSQYFICDIQEGQTFEIPTQSRILFMMGEGIERTKKLNLKDYHQFWQLYNKATDIKTIQGIRSKADRLSDDFERRFEGEFYTPIHFAKKAIDYLNDVIGGEARRIDWASERYRLWDMACGSGNLEYHLPSGAYPYCYLSTLRTEDVVLCKRIFREATVFQYDYLRDDVENVIKQGKFRGWKMPQQLVDDLANPELEWIVFINPPFATAQNKKDAAHSKKDVSMTPIRELMTIENLGETSRELFAQFLYRIKYEFKDKKAWLGLFSKIKYINANNDNKLRQSVFRYQFKRGFIFDARNFANVTGKYPIGFLVWDLNPSGFIEHQHITVDMLDRQAENFGKKHLFALDKKLFLNNWIERPKCTEIFPPFSSALNIAHNNKDVRDRISKGFICSLCTKGNDIQNQNYVALYSGPYVSAGALSVTKDNFLKAMIIHAVRKTYKSDWPDDRDQFYQPYRYIMGNEQTSLKFEESLKFPLGYAYDCVVWSLFANSNQSCALADVAYKGNVYQIKNHLFPFTIQQVSHWGIQDGDIATTMVAEKNDRFAASWILSHRDELSQEAQAVLNAASNVYKIYFKNLNFINTSRYKVKTWDAGLYQVKNGLKDADLAAEELKALANAHENLAEKIRSKVRELGFMR